MGLATAISVPKADSLPDIECSLVLMRKGRTKKSMAAEKCRVCPFMTGWEWIGKWEIMGSVF